MAIQAKFQLSLNNLKDTITASNRSLASILESIVAYPGQHIENKDNPHGVDAGDVGLENLPNWTPASRDVAVQGLSATSLISPARLDDYMDANVYTPLSDVFDAAADRL